MDSRLKYFKNILLILLLIAFMPLKVYSQESATLPGGNSSTGPVNPDSKTYVLGPEDILFIQVWGEEALSQQVQVRPDGKISLPLIDEVQAGGLSPLQLKEGLTERFKQYVESPRITVIVREARSFKVYVSGQVVRPGVFSLVGETTILQIIPMAGGFSEWANQRKVLLIRREKGKESRMTINFKDILSGKDPNSNIVLKPGDTIIVPD